MDQSISNLLKEITEGARRAGVPFEHERNGRKHRVYRLGSAVTIIIPNSTIKPPVRHDILRQCVPELGERWWANDKAKTNGDNEMARQSDAPLSEERVNEEWRPVHGLETLWEISNAGRVRNQHTKRLVQPTGNSEAPFAKLTDRKGRVHNKNIIAMCRTTFGHKPLKNVWLDTDPDRERKERVKVRELHNPISHLLPDEKIEELKERAKESAKEGDDMTIQASELGLPVDTLAKAATTDPDGLQLDTDWREVRIKGVKPGYQISEYGEVLGARGPLVPLIDEKNQKVTVNLRRIASSPYRGAYTPRLDMVMCEHFHGSRPGPDHGPKHLDGDWRNCAASNLRWAEGYAPKEAPKSPPRMRRAGKGKKEQAATTLAEATDKAAQEQPVSSTPTMEEYVRKVVDDAPSWSHPGLTVKEANAVQTQLDNEVQVVTTKTYVCGSLVVPVGQDGKPKFPPTEALDLEKLVALGKIAEAIKQGR